MLEQGASGGTRSDACFPAGGSEEFADTSEELRELFGVGAGDGTKLLSGSAASSLAGASLQQNEQAVQSVQVN